MTVKNPRNRTSAQRRSSARLAAVQALYDVELTGAAIDAVLRDFLEHGIGHKALVSPSTGEDGTEVEAVLAEPDAVLLAAIVRGVGDRHADFDQMIDGALTNDWTAERLEPVLRAILRAGAFELSGRVDVPVRVVISEYVDVAHAFYSGPEPKLVNAVLDRIARVVRSEEIDGNGRA
jgi:N utilization substance protein B